MLLISMCFPYGVWLLVYSSKSLFGSSTWPSFSLLSSVLLLELLHTLGLCLLVFRVLPALDMMRGFIVLSGIYVVPAFLKTIFESRDPNTHLGRKCSLFMLNIVAFLIQLSSMVLCLMFQVTMTSTEKSAIRNKVLVEDIDPLVTRSPLPSGYFGDTVMFELPLALILISCAFWENFVEGDFEICGRELKFNSWKKLLHHARGRLYIFVSVWKALWVVAFAVLLQQGFTFNLHYSLNQTINTSVTSSPNPLLDNGTAVPTIRLFRRDVDHVHSIASGVATNVTTFAPITTQSQTRNSVERSDFPTPATSTVETSHIHKHTSHPFTLSADMVAHFELYGVLYLQIISSSFVTYFGSLACKLCMQLVGFSLPLTLASPAAVAVVVLQSVFEFLPTGRLVWVGVEADVNSWALHLVWIGILWLSEIFIVLHIWFPGNGRMEKIDRLFVTPVRCGILSDQSLMLRRRRNDQDQNFASGADDEFAEPDAEQYKADDVVPQIYACATMWHETRAEMTNLLKSIFRMDIDHSGRYLAQKFYKIRDPDYYEFEAHIFFDDAMELTDDDSLVPNMFVSDLMDCIDDSLSSVHERQMALGPPSRTPTPYGGRLTWKLPGGTRLIAHLKDKHKIRHKKRWSQVMYMYYLLGYRILAKPENLLTKDEVDGSHDDGGFQRVKLTDSQLRRRRRSAHFTRSVIFNYVTDEVHSQAENTYILTLDGDVDFHPNAVRLLIDSLKTNKKVGAACGRIHPIGSGPLLWYQQFEYAIGHWLQKATEHVFGCVMCAPGCFSLFRGSALMDDNVARTYATRATEAGHYVQCDQGEDRWLSTLLLQQGYRIDYCAAADALTHAPETFSEFFNQRRRWGPSTLANIVDLLGSWRATISINDNVSTLYILYQFCMIISTILGPATVLLMLAGAFTVVFKTSVLGSYCMALIPAVLFMVVCIYAKAETQMTVASIMSAIYAILMTIVLVGTIGQAIDGGMTSPNVIFLVLLVFIFFISALMHPEEFFCVIPGALYFICLPTGYLLLTIYYLCNMNVVSWGTREIPTRKTKEQLEEDKRLEEEKRLKNERKKKGLLGWMGLNGFFKELGDVLKQMRSDGSTKEKSKTDMLLEELIHEMRSGRENRPMHRMTSSSTMTMTDEETRVIEIHEPIDTRKQKPEVKHVDDVPVWLQREELENPSWLNSNACGDGPVRHLSEKESVFWNQIIAKYLHPINEDRIHQEKVANDLKNLRNNVVFGFFMSSALWIALAMQLQILQDELKDKLFIKIPRFDSDEDLAFEPLGLIFLVFFAAILGVQFLGMFVHRWGTVLHMLSITELSCGKKFSEKDKVRDVISKAMELQKLCNIENEPMPDYDEPIPDYGYSDVEDEFDSISIATADTMNSATPSFYNSNPLGTRTPKQEIFDRRGHSSGAALRKAFEKRFRYEHQNFRNDEEGGERQLDMNPTHARDPASIV
ncbi:chitin synthase chs-2-like [Dreissena polymorpha]|nr:chitin synthase chs-2-like [Dreissena polymorpha]